MVKTAEMLNGAALFRFVASRPGACRSPDRVSAVELAPALLQFLELRQRDVVHKRAAKGAITVVRGCP